ncbi:hypothetical protein ACQJBY_024156 [Aegilops geniculata]
MQSPNKLFPTSIPKHLAVSTLQGWADLPDGLLHSIVAILGSCFDLLAFAATCRSWHAAFFSYPSKSTLCALCPPLLIWKPPYVRAPSNGRHKPRTFHFIDPANPNTNRRYQIREEILHKFRFAGSSYGHLIFIHHGHCLLVDAFSGAEVSPLHLPELCRGVFESYYCSMLTAPLASPNSRLLVNTVTQSLSSLFEWQVGSDSWSELKLSNLRIEQIVELNGQFIAMDDHMKLYTLQLAPQLALQDLPAERCGARSKPWLVVCGDMLLMVRYSHRFGFHKSAYSTLHRLDMSTNPAKWVEMKKLDNWALFVAADIRNPPFSCINPERWGGRSNCLYYTHDSQPCGVHSLSNEPDPVKGRPARPNLVFARNRWRYPQSLWVYPSMIYSDGRQ